MKNKRKLLKPYFQQHACLKRWRGDCFYSVAMAGPGRIAEFRHVPATLVARLFNFDVAQDRLKAEHHTWLRVNVVPALRKGGSLWLMGLTSTTGPESFNAPLSQRRAESVVAFLRKELTKDFPVKLEVKLGLGEIPARIAGLDDNTEDANWRAVVVAVWNKSIPPPPPPPPPQPPQEECKRTVIRASDGVSIYVFLDQPGGRGIIEQVWTVKASPNYLKCATAFERRWSFLTNRSSHPVVLEYQLDPGSNVVGEAVGHLVTVNLYHIWADRDALKLLPKPYYKGGDAFNIGQLPLDAFLLGYTYENNVFVSLPKVPLFVSLDDNPRYYRMANNDEDSERYEVVTDVFGQILANRSTLSSLYPKRESSLSIGVKTVVKQTVKTLIF